MSTGSSLWFRMLESGSGKPPVGEHRTQLPQPRTRMRVRHVMISAAPSIDPQRVTAALDRRGIVAIKVEHEVADEFLSIVLADPPSDFSTRVLRALEDLIDDVGRPLLAQRGAGDTFFVRP